MRSTHEERKLIAAIQKKRGIDKELELFDSLLPTLKKLIKAGGTAEQVLKQSEPHAAVTLVSLLGSDKDDVRRAAAKDLLDRTLGKPVERSVNIYGNVSQMADGDLDRQIMLLAQATGSDKLLAKALEVKIPTRKELRAKNPRRKRKIELPDTPSTEIIDTTATVVEPPKTEG